jgi:hypothetical protein
VKAAAKPAATKPAATAADPSSGLHEINRAIDELAAHRSDLTTVELAIRGLQDNDPESVAHSAQRLGYRLDETMRNLELAVDIIRGERGESVKSPAAKESA